MSIAQDRSIEEHARAIVELFAAHDIAAEDIRSYSVSFNGRTASIMAHLEVSRDDLPGEYWDDNAADFTENGIEVTLFAKS